MPTKAELAAHVPKLAAAYEQAVGLVRWVGSFSFPDFERDYEFVSLHDGVDYPIIGDRLVSSAGLDIPDFRLRRGVRGTARGAFHRPALQC